MEIGEKGRAVEAIRFFCRQCGKAIKVDAKFAGKAGRCPGCQTIFRVPASSEALRTEFSNGLSADEMTGGDGSRQPNYEDTAFRSPESAPLPPQARQTNPKRVSKLMGWTVIVLVFLLWFGVLPTFVMVLCLLVSLAIVGAAIAGWLGYPSASRFIIRPFGEAGGQSASAISITSFILWAVLFAASGHGVITEWRKPAVQEANDSQNGTEHSQSDDQFRAQADGSQEPASQPSSQINDVATTQVKAAPDASQTEPSPPSPGVAAAAPAPDTASGPPADASNGDDWTEIKVGVRDRVYFRGGITEDDAEVLGEMLRANGTFSENGNAVWFSSDAGEPTISFVVNDYVWNDGNAVGLLREMVKTMAPKIGGLPITLRLLNSQMESKREIRIFKPTINDLIAQIKKACNVPNGPTSLTFNYGYMPDCWKVTVGEPDSIRENESYSAPEWQYDCSDGAVVIVVQAFNTYAPNVFSIVSLKEYPHKPSAP
jgi:hypothetical protein